MKTAFLFQHCSLSKYLRPYPIWGMVGYLKYTKVYVYAAIKGKLMNLLRKEMVTPKITPPEMPLFSLSRDCLDNHSPKKLLN